MKNTLCGYRGVFRGGTKGYCPPPQNFKKEGKEGINRGKGKSKKGEFGICDLFSNFDPYIFNEIQICSNMSFL